MDINYSYIEKIRARLEPCKHRSFRTAEEADACELLLAFDIAQRRIVELEREVVELDRKIDEFHGRNR